MNLLFCKWNAVALPIETRETSARLGMIIITIHQKSGLLFNRLLEESDWLVYWFMVQRQSLRAALASIYSLNNKRWIISIYYDASLYLNLHIQSIQYNFSMINLRKVMLFCVSFRHFHLFCSVILDLFKHFHNCNYRARHIWVKLLRL